MPGLRGTGLGKPSFSALITGQGTPKPAFTVMMSLQEVNAVQRRISPGEFDPLDKMDFEAALDLFEDGSIDRLASHRRKP